MPTPAPAPPPSSATAGVLTLLALRPHARAHEHASHRAVAQRLAALLGRRFQVLAPEGVAGAGELGYVVPDDTLVTLQAARRFGIRTEGDFFGGVVPSAYVATKAITHPLVASGALAPAGWAPEFAERVKGHVLPGFTAFGHADARDAARRLLHDGTVRLKPAGGIGGRGQIVAADLGAVDAALAAMAADEIGQGLVIEHDLAEIRTFSVGMVSVPGLRISYVGTQRVTRNRRGEAVYGGSSLEAVRGGLDALAARTEPAERLAIEQARIYHEAALACFPGLLASRCNYDVAAGHDAAGRPHAGVLEQSWRIGGASGAEVAALEVFAGDPSCTVVRTSTWEVHGADAAVPGDAIVSFAGVDEELGPVTKYTRVETP